MPNQSGPTSAEGKAKSSRNAVRHGLNNLQPVVTEASRPEYDALVHNLFLLLKPGRRWWRDLLLAVLVGAAFTAVFGVTQWFFAKFLLSPAADNGFFAGNRYWTYFTQMGSWRQDFWRLKEDPINGSAIFWSMLWAVLASYAGLLLGNWMTKVKR